VTQLIDREARAASYRAPVWQMVLVPPLSTAAEGEITEAHDRKLHIGLDEPCSASFTINGRSNQASQIQEMELDLMMARNEQWFFRGRLASTEDTIDQDSHKVTVTANDYRSMLDRRFILAPVTFNNIEQTEIGWSLINTSQGQNNGDYGIRRGQIAQTGQLRVRSYDVGKSIGEALTQLGDVIGGFDWEIDPNLHYNAYYPQRGSVRGLVLDYGTAITNIQRQWNSGDYGNVVIGQGGPSLSPVIIDGQTAPLFPGGRIELSYSNPDLVEQTTLQQQTQGVLTQAADPVGNYTVQLATGVWAPNLLWIGDTCRLVVRSGRLQFDAMVRVLTIDITISDDGGEAVQLELSRLQGSLERHLDTIDRRLSNVERWASSG
jgi:hypothetical protein